MSTGTVWVGTVAAQQYLYFYIYSTLQELEHSTYMYRYMFLADKYAEMFRIKVSRTVKNY
jgi:hypothetical protein